MERGRRPGKKQILEVLTFLELRLSEENLKSGSAFYYDMDPDFNLIQIQILLFGTDLDPYRFKEVMYLKQYILYIFT